MSIEQSIAKALCVEWWGSEDYPHKDDFENLVSRVATALKVAKRSVQHEVIQAAYRPRPMCRDCADNDGLCPKFRRSVRPIRSGA